MATLLDKAVAASETETGKMIVDLGTKAAATAISSKISGGTTTTNTLSPAKAEAVKQTEEQKTILKMPPVLFYSLCGALALITGIIIYKKIKK